ncbi:MAG: hypothetical protein AABY04_02385 [Candidatus Micrarchaeota archaeon]
MDKIGKVISILKKLDYHPKIDSFKDRLVIQKTVSILESLDIKLGYEFSIHLRGPYCRELTEDIYENKTNVENLRTNFDLSAKEEIGVMKYKEVTELDPDYLEIISTYFHYLLKEVKNEDDSIRSLKALKPHLSDSKIAVGISKSKELLPPNGKQIDEMKKEFDEWDKATVTDLSKWD